MIFDFMLSSHSQVLLCSSTGASLYTHTDGRARIGASYSKLCHVFIEKPCRGICLVCCLRAPSPPLPFFHFIPFRLAKSCISRSLSGLALRQCIELGFHRNPRRLRARRNSLELEMQKRLFWISYALDRCAAVTLGRPFGISDSDIDLDVSPLEIST